LSSIWDCLSGLSEISIASDVGAAAGFEILAKVPANVGIMAKIPASIRIPVRIKASFGILVRIPASIRNPIRVAAKVRVLLAVRILYLVDGFAILGSAIPLAAGIGCGRVHVLSGVFRGAICPWGRLGIISLVGTKRWERARWGSRIQHPVPVSNIFYT